VSIRLSLLAIAVAFTAPAFADPVSDATTRALPDLMTLYRDLHAHPELSTQETASAAKMAAAARKAGFTVTEKVGGTGVVAVMRNGDGPVLMIRADMDGLPVHEETGLPFASKVRAVTRDGIESGVMHACGHDTHMASWVGTLRNLAALKDQWRGTLVMIAQPAEETTEGARNMLADGLYERFPKPTHAIAFHDNANLLAGTIGIRTGYMMANVDSVNIVVRGVGGHGAFPNTTKDPIVLASRIVVALQTLVSREIDPQQPAVVTVGSFHAGSKRNIIPDEATLLLTVRSYAPEVRQHLLDGIARIARGEAIAAGIAEDRLPVVTVQDESTPATLNTEPLMGTLQNVFIDRFGKERVTAVAPVMGGEDFSRFYLADTSIQSAMFWVGGVPKAAWDDAQKNKTPLPSLHSAKWAPDAERVISTATEALTAAALDILEPAGGQSAGHVQSHQP
jgi:hippurate hydrolase